MYLASMNMISLIYIYVCECNKMHACVQMQNGSRMQFKFDVYRTCHNMSNFNNSQYRTVRIDERESHMYTSGNYTASPGLILIRVLFKCCPIFWRKKKQLCCSYPQEMRLHTAALALRNGPSTFKVTSKIKRVGEPTKRQTYQHWYISRKGYIMYLWGVTNTYILTNWFSFIQWAILLSPFNVC